MANKRVFVSFDFDNDKVLKDFIIGQSRLPESPFDVIDFSLKEAAPEADWLKKAARAISRAEVFLVMLGPETRKASGVKKEIKIANELGLKKGQVVGYQGGTCDWAVPGAGRCYLWSWDNLEKILG